MQKSSSVPRLAPISTNLFCKSENTNVVIRKSQENDHCMFSFIYEIKAIRNE